MATEYKSRLLLNGADTLVLNGGSDILALNGNSDFNLDDLSGAGSVASAPGISIEGGPVDLNLSGGGASAEVSSPSTALEYPSALATASASGIDIEPGPIDMTLESVSASASSSAYTNEISVQYVAGAALAVAMDMEVIPGPIETTYSGAGATAGTDAAGYDLEVFHSSSSASAGVGVTSLETGIDGAGATAGATTNVLRPVSPNAPTLTAIRSADFTSVSLTWSEPRGATSYEVFRTNEYRGVQTLLSSPNSALLTDSGLATAESFTYSVRAINSVMNANGLRSLSIYVPGQYDTLNP